MVKPLNTCVDAAVAATHLNRIFCRTALLYLYHGTRHDDSICRAPCSEFRQRLTFRGAQGEDPVVWYQLVNVLRECDVRLPAVCCLLSFTCRLRNLSLTHLHLLTHPTGPDLSTTFLARVRQ